ncbi:MAG: hypothetical protein L0Y71_06825 [Gemmataceae bacterium]|nr:hypothetical protein [Gemmataceae bacterium]
MARLVSLLALSIAAPLAAQETDVARIDKRIADWQPTRAERRFDDIGWAPDLCTALKAGKAHARPIFLFTHDGRMQFGRC